MTADRRGDLLCVLLGLVAALASLPAFLWLVGGLSDAAPAPLPRPVRRTAPVFPAVTAELAGEWTMRWNGSDCATVFYAGGGYTCIYDGTVWSGTWAVRGGRLSVAESTGGDPSHFWGADLVRAPRGFGAHAAPVGDFALSR